MIEDIIKCGYCDLTQFNNRPNCRRCRRPFPLEISEDPEPQPELSAPEPERSGEFHASAVVSACLRRLRKHREMSQRDVGKVIGVPRSWISKMETGSTVPTMNSLERLAAALRVPVVALVDTGACKVFLADELLADPFIAEIAPYVQQLSRNARSELIAAAFAAPGRRSK